MATDKTRGRESRERTYDAALRAAEVLEASPRTRFANEVLRPTALVLRFFVERHTGREVAASATYEGLIEMLRFWQTAHPELAATPGSNEQLLRELKPLLVELERRLANYLDAAVASREAADAGIALAATGGRLLGDAKSEVWRIGARLEEIAVDHV